MSLVSHPELFPKISSRFPAGGGIYTFTRSGSQSLSRDFPAGLTRLDLRVKWRVWPRPSVGAVPGSFFRHDIRNELKAPLMRQQLPTNSAATKVKNKLKISYLFLDVIYFVQHMTCANLPPAPQMGSPPNRRWIRWAVRDMVHLAFCQAMRTAPPTAHCWIPWQPDARPRCPFWVRSHGSWPIARRALLRSRHHLANLHEPAN